MDKEKTMPGEGLIETSESNVIRLEAEKEEDAFEKIKKPEVHPKHRRPPKKSAKHEKKGKSEPIKIETEDGEVFCRPQEFKESFLEKLKINGEFDAKAAEQLAKDKKDWTEEERKKLQEEMDKQFDEFINGLERRQKSEAWPEDKWEEEMEKHPFFMKNAPTDGNLPPLLDGLCQLKYSSTENTPEELASAFKDDGNFNFKCKNYRMAIISFTEGISKRCKDDKLNAQLYNNRSAAHFFLKNYRSCFNDCKKALKYQPHYPKASLRLVQCALEINEVDEAVKEIEILLSSDPLNIQYRELKEKAVAAKKFKERNERKEFIKIKKQEFDRRNIEKAIQERGIKLLNTETANLENNLFKDVVKQGVHLDDDKRLIWPVILLYPEYKISDIIQCFHEDSTFEEHFQEVFAEYPDWDVEKKYRPDNVNIYYEDSRAKIHQVEPSDTLGSVLSRDSYFIDAATPSFIIMAKNTEADSRFVEGQASNMSSFQ